MTTLDDEHCYRALQARDRRFDGQFFVTVITTGIYCRPSCPARTPRRENVDFVLTAAAAQQRGFRACRRCLPDAVPGSPLWNTSEDLSSRAMRLISDGVVERDGVDGLATRLGYSPRHLNRVLTEHLGAGPLALARAHRATNARILIQCTPMPMADIAFAAGFASIRQFNDTIREVFALTPTQLRALARPQRASSASTSGISLRLAVRQPFDAAWLGWFLGGHAAAGVESHEVLPDGGWRHQRVLSLPHGPALATLTPAADHIAATLDHLDLRDLGTAVNRLRRYCDLDADVAAAEDVLRHDPALRPLVDAAPGIRVPGSLDGAETLVRTMIGQQISVAAARVHVARLVAELGRPVPWSEDLRAFPTATAIAEHGHTALRGPARRIDAIIGAAAAVVAKSVEPDPGVPASDLHENLMRLPGVGRWTADYVTMRTTGDPDVLLSSDLVVRHAARDLDICLETAEWAPWRSYASMHLWRYRLATSGSLPATSTVPEIPAPRSKP